VRENGGPQRRGDVGERPLLEVGHVEARKERALAGGNHGLAWAPAAVIPADRPLRVAWLRVRDTP